MWSHSLTSFYCFVSVLTCGANMHQRSAQARQQLARYRVGTLAHGNQYHILLLIGDGAVSDDLDCKKATVEAIVRASEVISFIRFQFL